MRSAIDRYQIGTELEVDADDFDNQYYIPNRTNRFYCPECNEIVFFRAKGGNHPNQFYHQVKTDRAPECDKRVDGRSGLSLNERIGLPIFITGIISGKFQINIGFPALGTATLDNAAKYGCTVKIASLNANRTVKVDFTNFLADNTTLIPINFVPSYGKNYTISVTGSCAYSLKKKWSDYADGFETGGAIFSYSETGGKKIRRGDSISTNKDYYAVVRGTFLNHKE